MAAADRTLATEPETAAHHLQVAARAAQENLREARALVGALAPDEIALTDALRRLAQRTQSETGLVIDVSLPATVPPLATGSQVALLRVAQEALANAARHARAARVTLTLKAEDALVRLVVADDGDGFDPSRESPGYGLPGMRERMVRLGGTLDIDSHPGRGTRICAQVPA